MRTLISGLVVLIAFSPLFIGCGTSHDAPPSRLTLECGIVDDTESFMNAEDQFLLLNDAIPDSAGICFLRSFGEGAPETLVSACAEYIEGSVSCEDAHNRMELCLSCMETWKESL